MGWIVEGAFMLSDRLTSVLVANRGEIASRVFRTARRLGLRTIAVYSEADRDALFVSDADEAHYIGLAPASESYLRADHILEAARKARADCIHPGYGFLSERAQFAESCAREGIVFIGPPASAIRAMGLKDAAKALAAKAGAPVVPGYQGARQEPEFLALEAEKIGWPVLIKAVAGGGGKGMRRVARVEDFAEALAGARREAEAAFGDSRVLIETYVQAPRHIEAQIFADAHGGIVSLFERDCSLQRRHQKVIEEAPAPGLPEPMRRAMSRAANPIAGAVGYVGAGTIEFIADSSQGLREDRVWFMEMNTRLQVEHPVTEAITGLDLVEWQFRIASGERLALNQDQIVANGHAVEARLYAEDPANDFLPSTGKLWALRLPQGEGLRVDSGVVEGDAITPYYDPMIAKIIAHGATRREALDRLAAALGRTLVAGPKTNLALLKALCEAPDFRDGAFDTSFIERNLEQLVGKARERDEKAIRAGIKALLGRGLARVGASPWDACDAFQLGPARRESLPVLIDGERFEAALQWPGPRVLIDGQDGAAEGAVIEAADAVIVVNRGRQTVLREVDLFGGEAAYSAGGGVVKSPMHGRLIALFVANGERVGRGQRLAIIEAMKMEHVLLAPRDGAVSELALPVGAQVAEGAPLMAVRAEDQSTSAMAKPSQPLAPTV
jgi:3-methylcrotonyl-CoA carboxylase alpha subunit